MEKLFICHDTFPIMGTYFGLLPEKPYMGQELKPAFRKNISTRDVGPIETKPATEELSWTVYELFEYGIPTGKYYTLEESNFHGWMLFGKEVIPFSKKKYFSETDNSSGFNSDNSMKVVHYPLRGNESSFKVINSGTTNYPDCIWVEC